MKIIFDKCSDAINHALSSNTYGVFYSKTSTIESSIHVHNCCEILFCLCGGESFLIDNTIYNVNDGDIFVINQFEPHKITFKENQKFERYAFQIHPKFIYEHSTEDSDLSICFNTRNHPLCNKVSLSQEEISYMRSLIKKLSSSYGFGDDIIKNNAVTEMLTFINGKFIQSTPDKSLPSGKNNKVIKDAIKYINLHYGEDIRLSDVALNSYVSVNHLCILFKKQLGTTVLSYILSKRISEAKKHLKNGKSITETYTLCGFNDYANFIRSFKKIVGVSPGKYASDDSINYDN